MRVITGRRILYGGQIQPGTIIINDAGKIDAVLPHRSSAADYARLGDRVKFDDYGEYVVMPGLVDAHVHLNEPGRTDWEGFRTGTMSAAAGGVTTVIDMPLNAIPPTTTLENFKRKIDAAQGQCWVDVAFWGGVVPGNSKDLLPLIDAGIRGFKCFMIDSGVDEFPAVNENDIIEAMSVLADQPTILMFHAEFLPPISSSVGDAVMHSQPPLQPTGPITAYKTFLESRPPSFETYAISMICALAKNAPRLNLHVVHLSAAEALQTLEDARADGIRITAETCFHYLTFAAESIPDSRTDLKCCPPIRTADNQESLWDGLIRSVENKGILSRRQSFANVQTAAFSGSPSSLTPPLSNGSTSPFGAQQSMGLTQSQQPFGPVLRTVVSDHSPCTPELKGLSKGDFFSSWGGISSVGLGLRILWTECLRRAGLEEDIGEESAGIGHYHPPLPQKKAVPNPRKAFFDSVSMFTGSNTMGISPGSSPGRSPGRSYSFIDDTTPTEQEINDILLSIWRWTSYNTSVQSGLIHRKGSLTEGKDADIVVFDATFADEPLLLDQVYYKNKISPYVGMRLRGRVVETILGGNTIYEHSTGLSETPLGSLILERRVS
ncbi:hypothetical protein CANCADRAFT_32254 [Tortispora caseinolytica NRRL Y-17796]|uniref:Amidohydrolase-related domain-containing protein n=1 Tax=Tortispora caseinolytica NRRL Y-17796 TaxID=767744 RepID=A0A1E4TAI1_9ASCO|nr:hypothetical protein CANCADRAFT_32254 [Tortispora caseinolytica NRRL Y-17796]